MFQVIDYTSQDFSDVVRDCDVVFDSKSYLFEEKTLSKGVLKRKGGFYINVASSNNSLIDTDRDVFRISIPEARLNVVAEKKFRSYYFNAMAAWGYDCCYYDLIFVKPNGFQLEQICEYITSGKIRPVVGKIHPLHDFRTACNEVESGHARGKVVIELN